MRIKDKKENMRKGLNEFKLRNTFGLKIMLYIVKRLTLLMGT